MYTVHTFLGDFLGGVEESDVDLCNNVPVPYHKVPFYPTVCNADRLYDNVDHLCKLNKKCIWFSHQRYFINKNDSFLLF